jgi:hypothetical protein
MPVFYKNKRIAGYIRTGLGFDVEETQSCWLEYNNDKYNACALGFAIIGKLGVWRGYQTFFTSLVENGGDEIKTISDILEIDSVLVEEINRLHNLDVPAEEIAECLEFDPEDEQYDLRLTNR